MSERLSDQELQYIRKSAEIQNTHVHMRSRDSERLVMLCDAVCDLRRKLAIAEKALEKYADSSAWYRNGHELECTYDSFDDGRNGWQDAEDALSAMRAVKGGG